MSKYGFLTINFGFEKPRILTVFCARVVGDRVGLDSFWLFKDVSLVGGGQLTCHVNDVMVVECEERSTNVVPIEDSWDVGLEEFVRISKVIKGDGMLKTKTLEDKIPKRINFVPNMGSM